MAGRLTGNHIRMLADAYERIVADGTPAHDVYSVIDPTHGGSGEYRTPNVRDWTDVEIVQACNRYLTWLDGQSDDAMPEARTLVERLRGKAFERSGLADEGVESPELLGARSVGNHIRPRPIRDQLSRIRTLDRVLTRSAADHGWNLGTGTPAMSPLDRVRSRTRAYGRLQAANDSHVRSDANRHGDMRALLILESFGLGNHWKEAESELSAVDILRADEFEPLIHPWERTEGLRKAIDTWERNCVALDDMPSGRGAMSDITRLASVLDNRVNVMLVEDGYDIVPDDLPPLPAVSGRGPIPELRRDAHRLGLDLARSLDTDGTMTGKDTIRKAVRFGELLLESYGLRTPVHDATWDERANMADLIGNRIDPHIAPVLWWDVTPVNGGTAHDAWMHANQDARPATPEPEPSEPVHASTIDPDGFVRDIAETLRTVSQQGLVDLASANGVMTVTRHDAKPGDPKVLISLSDGGYPDVDHSDLSAMATRVFADGNTQPWCRYDQHPGEETGMQTADGSERFVGTILNGLGVDQPVNLSGRNRATAWLSYVGGRLDRIARYNQSEQILDNDETVLRIPSGGLVGLDQFRTLLPDPLQQDRYIAMAGNPRNMGRVPDKEWNDPSHWATLAGDALMDNDADPTRMGCALTTPAREPATIGRVIPMYQDGADGQPYRDLHAATQATLERSSIESAYPDPVNADPYLNPAAQAPTLNATVPEPTPTLVGPSIS
ncbi:hypothetical protein COO72_05320 [Bifidobacterium callitrichos]|nr:hypothetical protein COO72_05320 [Bifidobacterium callitrichos]